MDSVVKGRAKGDGVAERAVLEASMAGRGRTKLQRDSGSKEPVFAEVVAGETLGPVEVTVDDVKCKQFAFTQDDYGAWYFGDSPFGGRIGHATILANDLLQVYYTAYDRRHVVGLHTAEQLEFVNPVFVGETVSLHGRYVEKHERDGRGYVVMEAVASGADGRVLLKHRGTEIMRIGDGVVGLNAPPRAARDVPRKVSGRYDLKLGFADVASATIAPNTGLKPLVKCVTSDQMAVYSYIGEYQHNIHNDLSIAQSVGLAAPICQGQQQACFAAELCTQFFGAKWFTSGHLNMKFIRPLLAESVISIGGVVSEIERTSAGTRMHVEVWIDPGDGRFTGVGWASALVAE